MRPVRSVHGAVWSRLGLGLGLRLALTLTLTLTLTLSIFERAAIGANGMRRSGGRKTRVASLQRAPPQKEKGFIDTRWRDQTDSWLRVLKLIHVNKSFLL